MRTQDDPLLRDPLEKPAPHGEQETSLDHEAPEDDGVEKFSPHHTSGATPLPTEESVVPPSHPPAELEAKPEKRGWEPIDVSKGIFRHSELHQSKQKLQLHLSKDLKPLLPRLSQRKAVTDMLISKRQHGITKKEIKMGLRDLKEQGKLKPFQVRKLRRKFGAF